MSLNDETRRIWDANAHWWDDQIGDGNAFQLQLIEPATQRLIDLAPGKTVLDIACGAGRMARIMAQSGAGIVACDFSERFIERARARTPAELSNVEYHVIDATSTQQLLSLGRGRFDGAVCTMALMDMAEIDPLFEALPALLKPRGWFVFSIMHPCFQAVEAGKFSETYDTEDGELKVRNGVKITRYRTPAAWKGIGIEGQPEKQYYFHRPLEAIFNSAFKRGMVIDGFEEPRLSGPPDNDRYLMWAHRPEIPPVLVVRMRVG